MDEGRQIEAGSATESSNKVVRLPRDWLGPHEELVPFGQSTPPPTEPDLTALAPNDFWGERAAAIHSAVQAPEDEAPDIPPTVEPTSKARLGRRHLAAAAFAGIAAVAALLLLFFGGSPNHVVGGARLNIAAIVDNGVARILNAGPPRVVPHIASSRTPRPPKHVRHRASHPHRAPTPAQHHRSLSRVSTPVVHESPPIAQPTYHPSVSSPAPRIVTTPHRASTTSSGATVSPTGQNGALGPVQSPNG